MKEEEEDDIEEHSHIEHIDTKRDEEKARIEIDLKTVKENKEEKE